MTAMYIEKPFISFSTHHKEMHSDSHLNSFKNGDLRPLELRTTLRPKGREIFTFKQRYGP